MVVNFSSFHRQSHGGCKAGKIDCMVGAALTMMDYNGTEKVSHLKQKVIDMIHRAETLYGCCLAASYEGKKEASGTYFIDTGACQCLEDPRGQGDGRGDTADDRCLRRLRRRPAVGPGFRESRDRPAPEEVSEGCPTDVPVENRIKMYRLVEKMAMESADTISDIHGGGSPEAHRVTIFRETNVETKKKAAKRLAGVKD